MLHYYQMMYHVAVREYWEQTMAKATNIIKKTLRGISKARKDYKKWSGLWLWQAPEYMITTYIAKEIATDYYVTLEQDAGELSPGPGKLSKDARRKLEGGRFDIVVWNDDDTPIVIIEVKNRVSGFSKISGDVENICSMVKRKNSLQYGLVAYYTEWKETDAVSAEKGTSERVESVKNEAYDYINQKGGLKLSQYSTLKVVGDAAWAGVVLKISKA